MRLRLSDIAGQAGVSEATVSRVLNEKPGVGEDTRRAVLTALDVLGYERPQALRKHAMGLIGLILPELENPIFPLYAQTIATVLANSGFTPVLCTQTPGGVTEDEYVAMLQERAVAGIIFVSGMHADTSADTSRYHALQEKRLPMAFITGHPGDISAPSFSCDDTAAATMAVEHLSGLGHKKIGIISGPERYRPVKRKLEGYRKAMAGIGEELSELTMFGEQGGHAAAARLIDRGATAILCGSDLMALGAIRAVHERGLSVPEDISVIGYDDSPLIAHTSPPLTTIRQPVRDIATAAARALLDSINGQAPPTSEYLYRPELVVRKSTGMVRS
ncbi:LacI family DNA-binding transcriptional regulator [Natronoglycomyces albus]|uniref:LacI family DNA-binding transcriptional regulator n=1 Tax=Natronoglycomyces albus TaxID=2811108 RepID=A0A895XKD3_9ACTN|nr:LacI family DNA-binding transcriptional regulator [Natronoglycomyces albus]QSB04272.1 LacI family DNA-binding transcriptional regulator [Natronoglycomyces albus]